MRPLTKAMLVLGLAVVAWSAPLIAVGGRAGGGPPPPPPTAGYSEPCALCTVIA
jgi:hypothetical protein